MKKMKNEKGSEKEEKNKKPHFRGLGIGRYYILHPVASGDG